VISWSVKAGDRVSQFDPICEVQSDKASVEITSRFDGVIKKLHYEVAEVAIVGKPLVDIDVEDEVTEGEQMLEAAAGDSNVHHPMDNGLRGSDDKLEPEALPKPTTSVPSTSTENAAKASPAVRHLLKQLNIDISGIQGSGVDGRVLKEDVLRVASNSAAPTPSATGDQAPSATTSVSRQDQALSLTPMQMQMFKSMTRSLSIPHFLYTHTVDCTSLDHVRQSTDDFNQQPSRSMSGPRGDMPRLTALPFIMKALSYAFLQYPWLNAHLDADADPQKPRVLLKGSHNFGFATDTPSGLLVPVVRDVQSHSVASLFREIQRLASSARDGKLQPEDFQGATFVISNVGAIGGGVVQPIIVAPMLGILAVGRASKEGMVLSWSADHRVLDGATVARCAETVSTFLQNVDKWGIWST